MQLGFSLPHGPQSSEGDPRCIFFTHDTDQATFIRNLSYYLDGRMVADGQQKDRQTWKSKQLFRSSLVNVLHKFRSYFSLEIQFPQSKVTLDNRQSEKLSGVSKINTKHRSKRSLLPYEIHISTKAKGRCQKISTLMMTIHLELS